MAGHRRDARKLSVSILGFHADNGSEYINHTVAELLEKLRVEFTKSRPRRSNDNGLAETKNGAIVRNHLGYSPIPQRVAHDVNAFCSNFLNPYVNFPPALLLPRVRHRREGQDPQALPARGHDDAVRKAKVPPQRSRLPQA